MTFQNAEELTEEEKSEWAMDIAYDMDEFFRQHDPQYAAEHPEEHAAKEEIYESLMAGRISALDEKLAALGQTHEDYLPSEIEKFKDATGYEEFLDFDPTVIREAIQNSGQVPCGRDAGLCGAGGPGADGGGRVRLPPSV